MSLITQREQYEPNQCIINKSAGHNINSSGFMISDYGGLGFRCLDTGHYASQHLNDDGISEDESLVVSTGKGRCGYRSLETIYSYFQNRVVYHSGDHPGDAA